MTSQAGDPRIDKMVAYLYGELPEAEARAFRRLLETDDRLRAEYQELQEGREMLSGWKYEEESVPSFVLADSNPAARQSARTTNAAPGWWARLAEAFRNVSVSPAWGLATAALLLLVVAVAGLRIEPLGNGIAFRFGDSAPIPSAVGPAADTPRTLAATGYSDALMPVGGLVSPESQTYLTRDEFDEYNAQLMQTLVLLLNEYDARRGSDVTGLVRGVYDQMSSQQTYDFQELTTRIDALGAQMLLERSRPGLRIEDLLDMEPQNEARSLELNPAKDTEE